MTTNKKNQHYIPKFYLRNFSYKNNEKQIGIYNIENKVFHKTAALKHQGSKDFFYGHDGILEDDLANIEGHLAEMIKSIVESKKIPQRSNIHYTLLLLFVALTHVRNPIVIKNMRDNFKELNSCLTDLNVDSDLKKQIHDMSDNDIVKLHLSQLKLIIDCLSDLKCKLFVNNTKIPFISSDFPVIRHNMFLDSFKWQHGKYGYACKGLQIFIPITPTIMIILFDADTYKVGINNRDVMELSNKQEIDNLNVMQSINCINTLFFDENINKAYVENLVLGTAKARIDNKISFESSYLYREGEIYDLQKPKNFISIKSTYRTKLNISCIKILDKAKMSNLDNNLAQVRPKAKKYR